MYGLVFTIDSIKSFTFLQRCLMALDIVLAVFIVLDVILLTKERIIRTMGCTYSNSL